MLVLDSSGSMAEPAGGGGTKIDAAKSALRTLVNDLPDEAEVGLRVFGAEVFSRTDPGSCEDTQQVVEPGTDNRDQLLDAIGDYKPYGETPIPNALREAAADLGDEGPRSIVLVSDGESTCAPDPCKVAAELADQGINLQIDVVGLSVSGNARNQLQCVADKGNGTYYDADDADAIVDQADQGGRASPPSLHLDRRTDRGWLRGRPDRRHRRRLDRPARAHRTATPARRATRWSARRRAAPCGSRPSPRASRATRATAPRSSVPRATSATTGTCDPSDRRSRDRRRPGHRVG
ncbi:MAG: VWA domain-containing protein [Nocardioidaceae bacterium]